MKKLLACPVHGTRQCVRMTYEVARRRKVSEAQLQNKRNDKIKIARRVLFSGTLDEKFNFS